MSWFSILPAHLTIVETWIIRFFVRPTLHNPPKQLRANIISNLQLLLGILTIGPWLILILYDLVLYIVRAATYEIPYFGGRARGRQKPRAPSLVERPSGRARKFSIGTAVISGSESEEKTVLRRRLLDVGTQSELEDAED